MTPRYLLGAASVSLLLTLAACGGSDGGPSYASHADSATIASLAEGADNLASNTLDEVFGNQGTTIDGFLFATKGAGRTSAMELAQTLVQRALHRTDLKGTMRAPARVAGPFLTTFSECTPTITGIDGDSIPIDTDADGVPDDYRVNFGSGCVSEDSAGTERVTYSGSLRLQDTGNGFFSYSFTLSNLTIKDEDVASGDFTSIAVNGNEAAQFAAALASHTDNFSVTETLRSGSNTISLTIQNTENASFDPDNTFSLALGDPLPAGNFNYTSDFRVLGANSGGEFDGNFRLSISTPTALHYNPGCVDEIDAGVLRGLLNGDSNIGFTVTWTGCGTNTFDVFGNTEPTT